MYGKIFRQMYEGSLVKSGWETLVTFQQLIVLANKHGEVDMTPEAIESITKIPLKFIVKGLAELSKPDPDSRSPEEEGRRIVLLRDNTKWGWRIVNYEHYRKIRSQEERRDYMATYQAERRAKQKLTPVNNVNTELAPSTKAVSSKHEAVGIKPCADARHSEIESFIKEGYRVNNVLCTWDGSEGKHLSNFLKAIPKDTTVDTIKRLICLRFNSDEPIGARPRVWIAHLAKYSEGKLDRFGKVDRPPSWKSEGMRRAPL